MEKENDKDDKKSDKQDKKEDKKALFVQRLLAYVLDFLIISFAASLIATPFMDSDEYDVLTKESEKINEQYFAGDIDFESYTLQYADVSYNMAKSTGILSIITIFFQVLYFVVFQIYNDGQTLGKKLMKIRVVSDDGQLTMNQMIFRALIADFILLDIISLALLTFSSRYVYFGGAVMFGFIQYLVLFISLFMVMYRKDGRAIHDKLAHTKVITIK